MDIAPDILIMAGILFIIGYFLTRALALGIKVIIIMVLLVALSALVFDLSVFIDPAKEIYGKVQLFMEGWELNLPEFSIEDVTLPFFGFTAGVLTGLYRSF